MGKNNKYRNSQSAKLKAGESELILDDKYWDKYTGEDFFKARVVEVQKRYVFVATEKSDLDIDTPDEWMATVAKRHLRADRKERNFLTVGDRVLCRSALFDETSPLQQCVVEHRSPRSSRIVRLDPMTEKRDHVIAANITQLAVIASYVKPKVKWGLIDRYLILAEQQEIKVLLILNKEDCMNEMSSKEREESETELAYYRALGYDIVSMHALNPSEKSLNNLKAKFKNELSLLSGHSGVGKSTLTNLLQVDKEQEQEVEEQPIYRKGRHTTSFSRLIGLDFGAYVVDTPGVKSLSLSSVDSGDLSWGFVEIRKYASSCKFRECKHKSEPGCQVIDAVEAGEISKRRYKSYLLLLEELEDRQ